MRIRQVTELDYGMVTRGGVNELIVADLDSDGKKDVAFLLRKDDKVKVEVLWEGGKPKKEQCDSDLIRETPIAEFVDDDCKLKFESFREKNETGLLIRTHETFTNKFLCRTENQSMPLWHNIGTPD
jgi:hypothetical protein